MNSIDAPQWSAWHTDGRQKEVMFATSNMKTVSEQIRREQQLKKQHFKLMLEAELYGLKVRSMQIIVPNKNQIPGAACKQCTEARTQIQLDTSDRRRNLINVADSWRVNYSSFCPILNHCLRFKKYNYPLIRVGPVEEDSKNLGNKTENQNKVGVISTMISDPFHRLFTWLLYKVLPKCLSSVTINPTAIDTLKIISNRSPGAPLVFLPQHRSVLDQVLINFVLISNNIQVPLTFMDDCIDLPIIGSLLRRLGVVFVKKYIDVNVGRSDLEYNSTVRAFIKQSLQLGHNLQIFLESDPTANGKPKLPMKTGLLTGVLEAVETGAVDDVLLIPISINYEKLPEDEIISRQLGVTKTPTVINTLRTVKRILNSNSGQARIDTHEPFSLKALVKIIQTKYSTQHEYPNHHNRRLVDLSTSSLVGLDSSQILTERRLVQTIAQHITFNATSSQPIMSTNLVAYLLLSKFRNVSVSLDELGTELDKLKEELSLNNIAFNGQSTEVIKYVAALLGPDLIKVNDENGQILIKATTEIPFVSELSYYSNILSPIFAVDSLVLTTINYLAKKHAPYGKIQDDLEVPEYEIQKACVELFEILRYEFIFHKPCAPLENVINESVTHLCNSGLLFKIAIELTEDESRAQRLSHFLMSDCMMESDSDSDSDINGEREEYKQMKDTPKIQLPKNTERERLARTSIIKPIIYCYAMTAECLKMIIRLDCTLETEFVSTCIRYMTGKVEHGDCEYGECISAATIKNALKLLEKWDVVEITTNRGIRLLSLTNTLYNSKIALDAIIDHILKFFI